jgi:hypothetical protein
VKKFHASLIFAPSTSIRRWVVSFNWAFAFSGPLGRAATMLHERFHLTAAGHGEDFFKKKPKPQTGYEKNQHTFRRVDNAEALAYLGEIPA